MRPSPLIPLLLALCACATGAPPPPAPAPVTRGPLALALEADPNGLWWDAASRTLYVADDRNNRVLQWTDAGGLATVAELPPAAFSGAGLGGLVRMPDGTLVVVRFGRGTAGDVVFVRPDGTTGVVPHLAPERRRIGLTLARDGQLYVTGFVRIGAVDQGTVARLTLDGTEQDVLGALRKPVGVLAVGDSLFVSDQSTGTVYRAPLSAPQDAVPYATLSKPDLLAVGPGGALLAGSREGKVFRIAPTGEVSVLLDGYQQPRGLAYDAEHRRLFVADHDGNATDGLTHRLLIVPLD